MPEVADELITDKMLAKKIHAAKTTLAKWRTEPWRSRYGLPFVRVGRRIFYRTSDVEAWITKRTVGGQVSEAQPTRRVRHRKAA